MTVQRSPEPSPYRLSGRPDVRIGDLERDQVCRLLSEHFGAGRLSGEEFEQRLDFAVQARTHGDLLRLLSDLPEARPAVPAAPPTAAASSAATGPSAFDVMFGLLGLLAAFCLLNLFLLGGEQYNGFGFFACLGGATVAAVVTHFIHRGPVRRS